MRVVIDNGRYMSFRSISDPHSYLGEPYDTFLAYQVYNEDGTPSTGSYRGEALVSEGMIFIGDPRYQANITELRISPEPTSDSAQRFEGFLRALDEKRKPSSKGLAKYENKSTNWWDGYRDGWEQKDERSPKRIREAKRRAKIEYNPRRKKNYLDSSASCELDANTIWPQNWSTGRTDQRGLEVVDRRQSGDRSVAAKDVWINGQWIGVYWFCLNRPDTEGWNWLAADGTKVEHTTLNNVQAERALVAHMGHQRQRNPEQSAAEFVAAHARDATWHERIPGGTTKPPRAFNPESLTAGTIVELEHTTDPAIAMEIAMDHLDRDPRHYDTQIRRTNPTARESRIASRLSRT